MVATENKFCRGIRAFSVSGPHNLELIAPVLGRLQTTAVGVTEREQQNPMLYYLSSVTYNGALWHLQAMKA